MGRGRPKRENPANGDAPAAKVARTSTKFELPLPSLPKLSGNVLSCGQGEVGQLGLGEDVFEKTRPALIPSLRDIVDISAGGMHNLCLTRRGEVYSFGCNDEGALGRATADEEGSEFEPRKIELPAPCLKISAGDSHSACLLNDGRVYAWGSFRVRRAQTEFCNGFFWFEEQLLGCISLFVPRQRSRNFVKSNKAQGEKIGRRRFLNWLPCYVSGFPFCYLKRV